MSLERRIARLEADAVGTDGRCPVCRAWPTPTVRFYHGREEYAADPPKYTHCPACGWRAQGITAIVIRAQDPREDGDETEEEKANEP